MRRFQSPANRLARVAALVLLMKCIGTAPAAEVARPYEVRVATPGAPVLSGPGENYYPTDTLAEGETVQVYRENSGGWLGIRPPQDSFSWVFALHVKRLDNGLAEIEKDDVPSRIGSRLSDQRNAVQIRLKKGEVVEIVGEQSFDGQTWYKIAPPSGEFRWIQARYVARPDQLGTNEVVPPELSPSVEQPSSPVEQSLPPIVTVAATSEGTATGVPLVHAPQATSTQAVAQQEWRAAPADALPTGVATTPPDTDAANNNAALNAADPAATSSPASSSEPVAPQPSSPIADGLARRLTGVELQLSRIVAEPPATWQIDPLARKVEQLLAQAQTADERKAVQSTQAKIGRFAAIGQRYRGAPGTPSPGPPPITPIGQTPITPIPDTRHLTPDTSLYDAVGILRPVVSKRAGAPQFALLNERGQVVSFVTPSPDVNLQPYVGHRIGITGSRGYIPEFQRAHVTAGRVAPLTEQLVR